MTQSWYSFYGSRLHLILEEDVAEAYNRRVQQFFDGQKRFKKEFGRPWEPKDPIWMKTDEAAEKAYNKIGDVIRLLVEINGSGLDIPEEECTFDGLLKL